MWGNFNGRDGNTHVLPIDEDGDMLDGHLQQTYCPCGPKIEKLIGTSRLVVVHDEPKPCVAQTIH